MRFAAHIREIETLAKRIEVMARAAKVIGYAAIVVSAVAFAGFSYCDYKSRSSATHSDAALELLNSVDYKGQNRYVGEIDAAVCRYPKITLIGAGMAIIIFNGFYILVFGRFP